MNIKENVIWKECKNGSMLYDTKNENKMILNGTSTLAFLAKFINHSTAEDIAFTLHSQYPDQNYDDILKDISSLLNDIDNSNFVTEDTEKRGFINLIEFDQQIDNAIFEITKRCNLECKHCVEGGSKKTKELSTQEIFDLLEELHILKVYRLVITGGEPFIREDLVEIIKKCTQKNIRAIVFTNGTLVSESFLDQIKDLNVLIRFSIDGADADTHDQIRGKDNFEKTISALKVCKEKGIDTGTSTAITSLNFDQYLKIFELGKELGAKEIELSEVLDKGSAGFNKELLLTQEQLEQLRVYNLKYSIRDERFRKGMGFEKMDESFAKSNKNRDYCCNAGISTCFISAEGNVYPCTLFKEYKEFMCGNVTEEALSDIWLNSDVFKKMRDLKVHDIKSCIDCECFKACPGGCRARAYAETKKLDGPMVEEFCSVSKGMYKRLKDGEFNYIWGIKNLPPENS